MCSDEKFQAMLKYEDGYIMSKQQMPSYQDGLLWHFAKSPGTADGVAQAAKVFEEHGYEIVDWNDDLETKGV